MPPGGRGRDRLEVVETEAVGTEEVPGATDPGDKPERVAWAPGRVNLIGEHTDYSGGLCLPMAIQLGTEIRLRPREDAPLRLTSELDPEPLELHLPIPLDPAAIQALHPQWGRYVAAVAASFGVRAGGIGQVHSTLPAGAGLSSSAALEVAAALALGVETDPRSLALGCQRAEAAAVGVPTGIMDQLASAAGVAGAALLLDAGTLEIRPVTLPLGLEVVVAHSGVGRTLEGSAYADRRAEVMAAEALVGALRDATLAAVEGIRDPVLRRRARHVVTENRRVRSMCEAFASGDLGQAGRLLDESHESLASSFEVSTPALDALAERLRRTPGCYGARLTGAGFGGCVVAFSSPGLLERAAERGPLPGPAWVVEAAAGAGLRPASSRSCRPPGAPFRPPRS